VIIASEDFTKEVGNIKPEQWKKITETLKVVKGFLDVDVGVLEAFKEDIKSTLTLKMEELLAPLQNSVDELWATALKPIMPYLQDVVGGIAAVIQWIADKIQDIYDFLGMERGAMGVVETLGVFGNLVDYVARQIRQATYGSYNPDYNRAPSGRMIY